MIRELKIMKIELLREHEEVDEKRLEKLTKEIVKDGVIKKPIVADKTTLTVLDGHHRLQALKRLGLNKIPVVLVEYDTPEIVVQKWGEEKVIEKEEVIRAALSGKLFPPKTTKHMVMIGEKLNHIEIIQEEVNLPLEKLK